jgi:hypothetical protein
MLDFHGAPSSTCSKQSRSHHRAVLLRGNGRKKASGYDSRRSRNNENDTHVAINGATNEDQSPGSGPFIADLLQIRGNAYAICQAEDLREVTRETTYCCS